MKIKKKIKYFILFLGILIILINNSYSYKEKIKEVNILNSKFKNISSINSIENEYIMAIEIPKINLYKGLYDINNSKNNINYNIQILTNSDMPDVKGGNLILAAHSGISKKAFFNDLVKLELNDNIYIYYNGIKYNYTVSDKYEIEKNGHANIKRKKDNNSLSLITCSRIDKTKQIVLIAELI